MTSATSSAKLPAQSAEDKSTAVVSVRFHDIRLEKLVRRAAVERDTSRSEFMADASIRAAREVLNLKRDEDLAAYLEAA